MTANTAIDARHVSKTFSNYAALRDVSLEVRQGELIALLGPSGSGKTTLLRIIAGLDQPDINPQTTVVVDGDNIAGRPAPQRRVGFVFQHYALFRHMSVFENIAFGLRVRPRKHRLAEPALRKRVNDLLELIQLTRWSSHLPEQLSGGQRQRVALARALAIEPSVLLLDEPFGALDAKVRQDLRKWLRELHQRIPVTTVLVTHDQEEALEVADRVVIMNDGSIEQAGSPDEVFHRPASEFVLKFLGNVNVFRGRQFVRPHELDIDRIGYDDGAIAARIQRIRSAGPLVKVELNGETGEAITVELTHERYRQLAIQADELVFVRIKPRAGSEFFVGGNNHRTPSAEKVLGRL
ncbi:MAG TPA: TOBE-like domain-containing protein [Bryobacteraceae bacterium]|nr:TOBE-like domain-containing protein [Bryobacteraceae bacterium]